MKSDRNIRISVVIATYRRPLSLKDTLSSMVAQTRPADEIIVVDNNSGDETEWIVSEFRQKLPIQYVFEPRQGVSFARNAGVKAANGEVVAFTDDDCVSDPDWLYNLELPFLRDPQIGLVGGEILSEETQGTLIEKFCIADAMLRVSRSGP